MNQEPEPDSLPEPMPAPQLPNLPASPDDPFQPDHEDLPPVILPPDPISPAPVPMHQAEPFSWLK